MQNPIFEKINIYDICSIPANEILILTSSKRQANRLKSDIINQVRKMETTQELPEILPLNSWIVKVFDDISFRFNHKNDIVYVLNQVCEQMLWDKVIKKEESENYLLNFNQTAILAMEAKQLINELCLDISSAQSNEEYRRFVYWKNCYYNELEKINAVDFDYIYEYIINSIDQKDNIFPKYVVLFGFIEMSPRLSKLVKKILHFGSFVRLFSYPVVRRNDSYICACDNVQDEWRQSAIWIAEEIMKNPNGKYAIVTPRLEKQVPMAKRILENYLSINKPLKFNVSSARSCIDWPITSIAISWLDFFSNVSFYKNCESALFSSVLLRGCYIDDVNFSNIYSSIELEIRSKYYLNITMDNILRELQNTKLGKCISTVLPRWINQYLRIEAWVRVIRSSLDDIHFPGDKKIDSETYQTIENLDDLFDKFTLLDPLFGHLNAIEVIKLFKTFARINRFQIKDSCASVFEVLDIQDAINVQWDALWVIGMDQENFPSAPNPNPFLPLSVLRMNNVPRATPEREFIWAQKIYSGLITSASRVIFSYSKIIDEQIMEPSFLISKDSKDRVHRGYKDISKVHIDMIDDSKGPEIDSNEINVISGIGLLEAQSRCPLWAFAKYRLGISSLPSYDINNSYYSLKRGILIHDSLSEFWATVKDQVVFLETPTYTLEKILLKCIHKVSRKSLFVYGSTLLNLEVERTFAIIKKLLNLEKDRLHFRIMFLEQDINWQYKNISLNVRPDRIDLLSEDTILIIDYKTGNSIFFPEKDWVRVRPINLQLPIYSLACLNTLHLDTQGLAIYFINAKELSIKGLSIKNIGLPGITLLNDVLWNDVITKLYNKITFILDEYINGIADNHYFSEEDLRFCDVMPFLRLNLDE
ncbi:MAG: PD-(D/E)XK nuclease family protein [Candidatus Kinetoplastibacterium crithidii]|nr:MAG: PD-(D/E)XK nuclease family protein [Candidatus Kinetoplastibacterium crithidii]